MSLRADIPSPNAIAVPFRLWQRLSESLRSSPASLSFLAPLITALVLCFVDYLTDWEFSFFVFYAIPILLGVWWVGRKAGYWLALICGILWWAANYDSHPYETVPGYLWAAMSRVIFFCLVCYAATAVLTRQQADAARIQVLEERRQLEQDLVMLSEHQQQRIGQDLHDGLCQHLAAISMAASALAQDLQEQGSEAAQDARLIQQSIGEAVAEARGLARGILPVYVDQHGLAVALAEMAKSTTRLTGANITVEETGDVRISRPEVAMHLYRIAQEAVANAVRHGQARHIRIGLSAEPGSIVLNITDDGRGFPLNLPHERGMGLRTMRYRAGMIRARLAFSPPGREGASIRCELPVLPG